MRKKGVLLLLLIILIVIVISGFIVFTISKNSDNSKTSIKNQIAEADNDDNEYRFLLESEINQEDKDEAIEKLESSDAKGVTLDGKLQLICPNFILYNVFGGYTDNFYSVNINSNNFLFPAKFDGLNSIGFFMFDSDLELQTLLFKYKFSSNNPTYDGKEIIDKDGWKFAYDIETGYFDGYYKLERGYLEISFNEENKKINDSTINDLVEKIIKCFQIQKEDIHQLDAMAQGKYAQAFILMEDKYSDIKLDNNYTLDLTSNVYVIHWYVSTNWKRNDIKLLTKDFKNFITVRESIDDYSLEDIQNSSKNLEIVPYQYNGEEIQLLYAKYDKGSLMEEANGAFLGFVTKINNRSYAFMYDVETDLNKQLFKGTDPKEKIDYIYNTILNKN